MSNYQVLLYGSYFLDLIYTGLPQFPELGKDIYSQEFEMRPGASFYTALVLHRLGVRCGWACGFGNDLFSRFVLERCQEEAIDPALFERYPFPVRRISSTISFPQDRAFVSFVDNTPLPPAPPLIRRLRPQWLLLPHLTYGPAFDEMAAACREMGTRIYMDCQSDPATLDTPGVRQALAQVDVFAPNLSEALHLTGAACAEDALQVLASLAPLAIIKQGAQGACARGRQVAACAPPLAIECVRDTTGAGDCFNAGFLFGMLNGYPLEKCLRAGNVCGGLAVAGSAAASILSAEQVVNLL